MLKYFRQHLLYLEFLSIKLTLRRVGGKKEMKTQIDKYKLLINGSMTPPKQRHGLPLRRFLGKRTAKTGSHTYLCPINELEGRKGCVGRRQNLLLDF